MAPFALFCLAFLLPDNSYSQFYSGSQLTFGKSRVQYNDFFWTYFRYDKFDTYFYLNGKELAIYAAEYADNHIKEIELELQSALDAKIQFIIFNNLSDLKQSNIGLGDDMEYYNTGGVTKIIGGKVMLYFDGDIGHFEQQIRAGIANVILNQMMYGSGVGSQIKNNALFSMPEWYMNGLIEFIAEGWNTEIDNIVRDDVLNGRYKKFNRLTGDQALHAGHSLWHYIATKYGESSIPNIVYMARLSRNIEKGFQYVVNLSYEDLVKEWLQYYQNLYSAQDINRTPPQGTLINPKKKPDRTYTQVRVSPDGKYVAYTYRDLGIFKVFLEDRTTGKRKKIYRGGYRIADRPDFSFPVLAWNPGGDILALMIERKGEPFIYFYNVKERKAEHQILYNFQKILDMGYSSDGSLLVFSAYQKGQSDIYVYNIASGSFEQITNDIYNDLNPRFINNSRNIIFASNRPGDTIRFYQNIDISKLTFNNDIFIYNYRSKNPVLARITNSPLANEIQPMEYSDGYLTYLSNQNGIYNRFLARFDSSISFIDTTTHYRYFTTAFPVTNYNRSILQQDVSVMAGALADLVYFNGNFRMYSQDMMRPTEITHESLMPTEFMEKRQKQAAAKLKGKEADTVRVEAGEVEKPSKKRFTTVHVSDVLKEMKAEGKVDSTIRMGMKPDKRSMALFADTVDLRRRMTEPVKDTMNKYQKARQLNYNVEFSINQTVTQLDFNYLNNSYQPFSGTANPLFVNPGLNLLLMIGMTDLMEDYRFFGGVGLDLNLVNNEYLVSFEKLKKRLDHQIVFHRQGLDDVGYYRYIRHKINSIEYIATYPFTPVLKISGAATLRYDRAVTLATDQVNLRVPDVHTVWGVLKADLTYDNTRSIGTNLYHGTRYKIFTEYYQLLNQTGNNVITFGFDFRNYQKVHRSMIWANRLAGGTSFGSNKLLYYMGGVDNALWPSFDYATPVALDGDYVFQTIATNMRGFPQNVRNGNSFILINSELRVPIFRYLFNRPIRSDFLNNFQVVAFGDIGTAWTGTTPYSSDNQLFTYYIYRKPLYIKVEMLKDPLVGGFGGGLRAKIFGYFIRGDLAWGVEDGYILKPMFYVSLSTDF